MKGISVLVVAVVLIAAVAVTAVGYEYYFKISEKPTILTGRTVTGATANAGTLSFLESCNPNRDRCADGLVCKLSGDNIYRCLRAG